MLDERLLQLRSAPLDVGENSASQVTGLDQVGSRHRVARRRWRVLFAVDALDARLPRALPKEPQRFVPHHCAKPRLDGPLAAVGLVACAESNDYILENIVRIARASDGASGERVEFTPPLEKGIQNKA